MHLNWALLRATTYRGNSVHSWGQNGLKRLPKIYPFCGDRDPHLQLFIPTSGPSKIYKHLPTPHPPCETAPATQSTEGATESSFSAPHTDPNLSVNWDPEDDPGTPMLQDLSTLQPHKTPASHNLEQAWASSPGFFTCGASPSRAIVHSPYANLEGNEGNMGTAGPHNLLPPDVVLLTLQRHPEPRALLYLLPSKQDIQSLTNDLKMAWRQHGQQNLHILCSPILLVPQ